MNEKKSIAKNSLYNLFYKGFTALFPLLTTSYISRVLMPEGVGAVAYANTVVTYFVIIATLGIPNYGVKLIASCRSDENKRSNSFVELVTINAVSTLVCIVIYYILVNVTSLFCGKIPLMNTMGILLILNFFNIDWFYQGLEEYGYITTRSIIVKIISFVLMLFLVKSRDDFLIYALILCFATAGNYFLNVLNARKYLSFNRKEKIEYKKHLKPVFVLLASAVATEVYTMLDTVMLEYYQGDAAVGYYTNAVKIVRMIYTVTIAMVATFYPRISSLYAEGRREEVNGLLSIGTKVILLISIPAVIGLVGTADYIVPALLGESFMSSVLILRILAILVFVFSIAYFLGHIVLMATGNEKVILRATICGAIVNATLNLILIPFISGVGAAIASVSAELIVTGIMMYYSKNIIKLNISIKYVSSLLISIFVMIIPMLIIKGIFSNYYIGLSVVVIVCVSFYTLLLLMTKNDIAISILDRLKR